MDREDFIWESSDENLAAHFIFVCLDTVCTVQTIHI